MTINDLILKLQSEKDNGVYAVLRAWMSNIKKLRKEAEEEKDSKRWLRINDSIDREFDKVAGFMWGLVASDYISASEHNELFDEMSKTAHG